MPEGPEIRRAADELQQTLTGRIAERVRLNLPHLKQQETRLSGVRVTGVDTLGKAMLTRFENGLTLYSHNQLYGRWVVVKPNQVPASKRQLRVAIENSDYWALLYSASEIEVLDQDTEPLHPFLSRLGPDVLSDSTTTAVVKQRLTHSTFHKRQLGNILTDQSFVAGLGNYLRCEILFLTGLHPTVRAIDCSDHQLDRLAQNILHLPRQSYVTGGITNDLQHAQQLQNSGASFEDARFYLFRREGKSCYQCGNRIEKVYSGSQACYICPSCQQTANHGNNKQR